MRKRLGNTVDSGKESAGLEDSKQMGKVTLPAGAEIGPH